MKIKDLFSFTSKNKWMFPVAGITLMVLAGLTINTISGCRASALLREMREAGEKRDKGVAEIRADMEVIFLLLPKIMKKDDQIIDELKKRTEIPEEKPAPEAPPVVKIDLENYVPKAFYDEVVSLLTSERAETMKFRKQTRVLVLSLEEGLKTERLLNQKLRIQFDAERVLNDEYRGKIKTLETKKAFRGGSKPFGFSVGPFLGITASGKPALGIALVLGFRVKFKIF
jgi:hypothetical protein